MALVSSWFPFKAHHHNVRLARCMAHFFDPCWQDETHRPQGVQRRYSPPAIGRVAPSLALLADASGVLQLDTGKGKLVGVLYSKLEAICDVFFPCKTRSLPRRRPKKTFRLPSHHLAEMHYSTS